jgi:hypothetical protein
MPRTLKRRRKNCDQCGCFVTFNGCCSKCGDRKKQLLHVDECGNEEEEEMIHDSLTHRLSQDNNEDLFSAQTSSQNNGIETCVDVNNNLDSFTS